MSTHLASRRERVALLYTDGGTQQAIADELGVSITTVFNDLKVLEADGRVRKRARGEAIAEGVKRYWDSPDGRVEREERSRRLRTAPPVERVCETCGQRFEMSAAQARHEPGRFCSVACHGQAKRSGVALDRLRAGRRAWRARERIVKGDCLTIAEVVGAIPDKLRRTEVAVRGHIGRGGLAATWDAEFRRWLVRPSDLPEYFEWLEHGADRRATRFKNQRFRRRWSLGREAGRLFAAGYSTADAADELGYTADYITKLWREKPITPAVMQARLRRRVNAELADGLWHDFRDVYRRLHLPPAEVSVIVDQLEATGEVERRSHDRRSILRQVSQIPD